MAMCQEQFLNQLQTIITRKECIKVKLDQGWYSELEMRQDLSWSACIP